MYECVCMCVCECVCMLMSMYVFVCTCYMCRYVLEGKFFVAVAYWREHGVAIKAWLQKSHCSTVFSRWSPKPKASGSNKDGRSLTHACPCVVVHLK